MLVYQNPGLVATLREQVGKGQIDAEEIGDHQVVERPNGAKLCLRCSKRADDGELERIGCEP